MIITGLQKLLEYPVVRKKSFIPYKEIIKDNINTKYYKKYCTILKRAIIEVKKTLFQQSDNNIFQ